MTIKTCYRNGIQRLVQPLPRGDACHEWPSSSHHVDRVYRSSNGEVEAKRGELTHSYRHWDTATVQTADTGELIKGFSQC